MKADDIPFGINIKRFLLSFLVLIGFSVNSYAIAVTQDMLAGKTFYKTNPIMYLDGMGDVAIISEISFTTDEMSETYKIYDLNASLLGGEISTNYYYLSSLGEIIVDFNLTDGNSDRNYSLSEQTVDAWSLYESNESKSVTWHLNPIDVPAYIASFESNTTADNNTTAPAGFTLSMLEGNTFYTVTKTIDTNLTFVNKVDFHVGTRDRYDYNGTAFINPTMANYNVIDGVLEVNVTKENYMGTLNLHIVETTPTMRVDALFGDTKWADRWIFDTEADALAFMAGDTVIDDNTTTDPCDTNFDGVVDTFEADACYDSNTTDNNTTADPCDTNFDGVVDTFEADACYDSNTTTDYNTTTGGVDIFQTIFRDNGAVENTMYDPVTNNFVADGDEVFEYNATNGEVTITDPENNSSMYIKYEGNTTVDGVVNYNICFHDIDPMYGDMYGEVVLFDDLNHTIALSEDSTFDFKSLFVDTNATEYASCVGTDINTLYNKSLYMVEPSDDGDTYYQGEPTGLNLNQMTFDINGTVQNFYYDMNSSSFVSEGNETFDYNATSHIMNMVDNKGSSEVKFDSTGMIDSFTTYTFCVAETRDGIMEYVKVSLIGGAEDNVTALMDNFTLDMTGMFEKIDLAGYEACSALPMDDVFGKPLYMFEPVYDDGPYQENYPYEILGNVTLPVGNDIRWAWMEAMPVSGWNWGYSQLGTNDGNNSYSLGVDTGKYILRIGMEKDRGLVEEYIYDVNTSTWLSGHTVEYIAVDDYGNIIPQEIIDADPYAYYNFIPNVTPVDTVDFNSSDQLEINMDLSAMYADQFTITGDIIVSGDFTPAEYCMDDTYSTVEICEWNSGGVSGFYHWAGSNRISLEISEAQTGEHVGWYNVSNLVSDLNGIKTFSFSAMVPSEGNYTLRVNKESYDLATGSMNWENFFFNPQTQSLVDDMSVQMIEGTELDEWGYTIWLPDTNATGVIEVKEQGDGSRSADFGEINFAAFASTQLKLNGTVTFDDADEVYVELIDVENGEWFGWTRLDNSGDDFNITLPAGEGEYIVRLSKATQYSWESYYYDATDSKFVMENSINWTETSTGMFIPDVNQTGSVLIFDQNVDGNITQDDIYPPLVIDFTALDSQFYTLEGNVTVPVDFIVGETQDVNGNWMWNNINFEVIKKDSGDYVGWFEVDRDSNVTVGGVKTYKYKIKLANAGDYLVRVKYENQAMNQNEGYFLDFNATAPGLINEMKVEYMESTVLNEWGYKNWIPILENSLVLSDANKAQTFNIDFVELENSLYKLSGTIKVPSGFVPSDDWENRAMIRVEAINADTGAWLGNGPISNVANSDGSYNYSITLLEAAAGNNIIVKLVKEEQSGYDWSLEAYYINFGDDHNVSGESTLVAEKTIDWVELNTTDMWGNTMWIPDSSQTGFLTLDDTMQITLDIDYGVMLGVYEANKLSFSGTIILSQAVNLGFNDNYWNNIRLEAIDKTTGDWVAYTDVDYTEATSDEFSFELEFAQAGDYMIKVVLELDGILEEYYINFGADHLALGELTNADKLVSKNRVEWIETTTVNDLGYTNWMPNPDQTGYITLSSKVELYEINFGLFESAISKVSGVITVEDGFVSGDKYDANGWWIGYDNLRVEAISKVTGERIASTDLVSSGTNEYAYSLKLGDLEEVGNEFIIKVIKESSSDGQWEYDEYYINFGVNHTYDAEDTLVNGKRVLMIESDTVNQFGYKNWLPDPEQTGWIVIGDINPIDVNVDLTTLGSNDITLSGSITFAAGFDLSDSSNDARVSVIDASNGMWIADVSVEDNGTYELNLGDASYATGDYILQVSYSHNDFTEWQNSWWKAKYLDFGENNAYDTTDVVLSDNEIQWREVEVEGQWWSMWVPDVNHVSVTTSITDVDIDVSVTSGGTISGTITGIASEVDWSYAYIVNPTTYASNWLQLQEQTDGTYTFSADEVKAGEYTVEFGYEKDGKYYHFFIKDDNNDTTDGVGTVDGQDVSWTNLGNGMMGPSSEDTTYVTIANGQTTDLNITLVVATYNKVIVTLNGTENDKYASSDMSIPGKSFGRWEQNTTVGTSVNFTFDDVKDGTGYILNFWYENNSYTCDGAGCESLKKNAMWMAFDDAGDQVCPTLPNNDWNCDWDNSYNWSWKPDVTPVTVTGDTNLTATLPQELSVSGALSLGSEFAGENVYVSIYQNSGNYDWNWAEFTLDANGEVNSSMKVDGGNGYRIELWVDGLGGYVYTPTGWITQNSSWAENNVTHMWEPVAETLVDINANLDLGVVSIGADLSTVTIVLNNIDVDANGNVIEEVWVSFESATNGWYGDGNANWDAYPITYDSNITIKMPTGNDYKLMVFPMNHKHGYVKDADSDGDFETIGWNVTPDTIDISTDTSIVVEFPSASLLGDINGTVVCDETNASANCMGLIEAYDPINIKGKSGYVNSDGTFELKGLDAGSYEVYYYSDTGTVIESDAVVTENGVTTITVTKDLTAMLESITGTVTAGDLAGISVVLIETDGTEFLVKSTVELDDNGSYSFAAMPKPSVGYAYVLAAAKRTSSLDFSTSLKFDEVTEVYDAANNVDFTPDAALIDEFATNLTFVVSEYP